VFDYDVAIVGGGPAGASTALHLVRAEGISPGRIVVLDKARFPRDKPCAGAVSQLGIEALRALGIEIDVPFVTLAGARVTVTDGCVGETLAPMGIVIRRLDFDASLLAAARHDGVVVRDGNGVTDIARAPHGFRLTTASSIVDARFVAICDGAGSSSRKLLGMREAERKGHLYVLETPHVASDVAVKRRLTDFDLRVVGDGVEGYYWDFPTLVGGVPHASRGIYHANLSHSCAVKTSLARALERRGIDIAHVRLKPFSTRPFVRSSILGLDGAVLVGEAAGIDRATGEGIAPAIVMAKIAARHLARALRTGERSFDGYARDVFSSHIGRHMLKSAWLARWVYGRAGAAARRYLAQSPYARAAALRWYRGETLSIITQLRLAAGLGTSIF